MLRVQRTISRTHTLMRGVGAGYVINHVTGEERVTLGKAKKKTKRYSARIQEAGKGWRREGGGTEDGARCSFIFFQVSFFLSFVSVSDRLPGDTGWEQGI